MGPESSFKMKVAVSVILLVMQRDCSNLTVTKLVKSLVVWVFKKWSLFCFSRKSDTASSLVQLLTDAGEPLY
jgi:hypothetical protein